jgi:hypothetical protein
MVDKGCSIPTKKQCCRHCLSSPDLSYNEGSSLYDKISISTALGQEQQDVSVVLGGNLNSLLVFSMQIPAAFNLKAPSR